MIGTKSPKKRKSVTSQTASEKAAMAIHAAHEDGEHHIVGLGNIRVLLMPDGDGFYAQGLEIDYAAQGDTLEDAKKEFEDGLEATVEEHLRVHGNINRLLQVAPNEAWNMATKQNVQLRRYTQITHHYLIRKNSNYEGIDYLVAATAA